MLMFIGKSHHIFNARAVVPAAVENDDLTGRGKVRHVTLHIHLALFAIARGRQRDDAENARAAPLADRLDRAAFAGRVTAFEYDNDSCSLGLDPVLKPAKLNLELVQMFLILFPLHLLGTRFVGRHAQPLSVWRDWTNYGRMLRHNLR